MGDVDAKAETMDIDSGEQVAEEEVVADLLGNFADEKKVGRNSYIVAPFKFFNELHFAYLEINPLVISADGSVVPLDLAAMVDGTAYFLCAQEVERPRLASTFRSRLVHRRERLTEKLAHPALRKLTRMQR